jgi:hypothetical protein
MSNLKIDVKKMPLGQITQVCYEATPYHRAMQSPLLHS